jgi:hypothetical protein
VKIPSWIFFNLKGRGGDNTLHKLFWLHTRPGQLQDIPMRLSLVYEVLCSKRWGEQRWEVVIWRSDCVACTRRKNEAFYTLRPTPTPPLQPRPLNRESQFKDCNPTTSPYILPWDLSWSSSTSFLLSPRRHNQNLRRHNQNPRRHGPKSTASWLKSTGVDQPINWPYLLYKTKLPKFKGTGGFIRH